MKTKSTLFLLILFVSFLPVNGQRKMENLGRGVVAVRTGTNSAFISWRLLGTESWDIGFNLYRTAAGGTATKLNSSVLVKGTNFTDNSINATIDNSYFVKPVINGVEQEASGTYILKANKTIEPCLVVPLKNGDMIHFVWVGDLNGDGEYDYLVDRLGNGCKVEAYLNDGTYLWTIDMGPNSLNMDNISPGSSTIDVGHWDGVTVYDMDEDGKAEVMVRTANGVIFGDGKVLESSDNNIQFVSVIDGMTGAERARAEIPNNYISVGPMACSMGIGHLNGVTPSLVTFLKNRNSDRSFNRLMCAWDFDGSEVTLKWKTNMSFGTSYGSGSDGHQMRIIDVDGDGKDDVGHVGFILKGEDGSLLYDMGKYGIEHGDRWFIGKLDPNRPGLQGYGIQQYNSILDYYYDAGTGELLWKHTTSDGSAGDVGRGSVGDVDPNYPGYEVWQFGGLYNGPTNKRISTNFPYPNLRIWWDGDLLSENLNDGKIDKYNVGRLVTAWKHHGATGSARSVPMFYGDIMGDWREEVVFTSVDFSELIIFTTNTASNHRIYTLPHNPAYRNSMTVKGYMQSHMLDYYLGSGMTTPPTPPIQTAKCIWRGDGESNMWDVASSASWLVDEATGTFSQGDNVLFDITGYPDTTVVLTSTLTPSSVKVISPINYAFGGDGTLSGNTKMVKAGSGALEFNCKMDYSGTTTVEEGALYVNDTLTQSTIEVYPSVKLGGNGVIVKPVTLMSGSILEPGAKNETGTVTFKADLKLPESLSLNYDFTSDSTGAVKPSDKILINGNLTISGNITLNINKVDGIIKAGTYPLIGYTGTFSGDLNKIDIIGLSGKKYTLKDTLNTISLTIDTSRSVANVTWNGATNTWDLLTSPSWNLDDDTVTFAANDTVWFNSTGANNQTVKLVGNLPVGNMYVDASGINYNLVGNGNIGGTGSIIKSGSGKLSLMTENSYKGKTIVNGGTLEITSMAEAGVNSSVGANESVSPSELVLNNSTLSYFDGKMSLTNKGLTLAGNSDTIEIKRSSATLIVEGVIAGTGNLVKSGPGTFTIKSANTFTGNTIISNGTLLLGNETANAAGLNKGSIVFENGTLSMSGGGYTEFKNNIIVPNNATGTLNTDDRCNYRGTLTGNGTFNVNLTGGIDRTIFYGDWSAFAGTINIIGRSGARFRIANSNGYEAATINLGAEIGIYHGGSGSSGADASASSVKIGAITGSSSSALYDENWIIGGNNKDCNYGGVINGNSITKVGTGILALGRNNTYTGGTTVSAGTLLAVNTSGTATGSGSVKIEDGGTLAGTGTIAGATTIYRGAKLMAGNNGIGKLKFNSTLLLAPGSSTIIDIDKTNNTFDQLEVSSRISCYGTLVINQIDTAPFEDGDSFTIFLAALYKDSFSDIVPNKPGDGLVWDLSDLATSGTLKVISEANSVQTKAWKNISLSPNPVIDDLTITLPFKASHVSVKIYSMSGVYLYNEVFNFKKEIKLSTLRFPKGVYLIELESEEFRETMRFVK